MSSSRERYLRSELRGRAWDVFRDLASAPEGETTEVIEESVGSPDGDFEVVITLRRRGVAPGPPVISLTPVQRFLPGCLLSDIERAIVLHLLPLGERRTCAELAPIADAATGRGRLNETTLKLALGRMADPAVGILDNNRGAHPPGYQLTLAYRELWAWMHGENVAKAPVHHDGKTEVA